MTRPLRIEMEDGIYHVTSRGLEKRSIVSDDRDRQKWTEMLGAMCKRRHWQVFAWALMSNHDHLFLRTPHADLSAGMHDLNSGYATWFNHRHRRCGPLFQGRFKAILVEREYHYWELSRYIHLNPVRAGLADRPETYRWSSCRFYFNPSGSPDWLAWKDVLSEHGRLLSQARLAYRKYLMEGVKSPPESPLKEAVASTLLGTEEFLRKVRDRLWGRAPDQAVPAVKALAAVISVQAIEEAVCRWYKVSPPALQSRGKWNNEARAVAIYLCRGLTPLRGVEMGRHFGGVKQQAISNIVSQIQERQRVDTGFRERLEEMEGAIKKKCKM